MTPITATPLRVLAVVVVEPLAVMVFLVQAVMLWGKGLAVRKVQVVLVAICAHGQMAKQEKSMVATKVAMVVMLQVVVYSGSAVLEALMVAVWVDEVQVRVITVAVVVLVAATMAVVAASLGAAAMRIMLAAAVAVVRGTFRCPQIR